MAEISLLLLALLCFGRVQSLVLDTLQREQQQPLNNIPLAHEGNPYKPLRYAVFGDSWASGINFGPPSGDLEFNFPDSTEVCRCRRVNEAWPVQLLRDNSSWALSHQLEVDHQACHGVWFADIKDQVARLNQTKTPDIAFLMIGGNPGGFPAIAENCVFQFNHGTDYGPEFPDPEGACAKTLVKAHETLHSGWFTEGLISAIYAILNEPRIMRNMKFRLFVVSYSALFNHDDPACDDWSFAIWGDKKQPKLTRELRKAINDVIDDGRSVYDFLINHILFDPRVQYVDANRVLAGHRFCEPTEEGTFEAQNKNSWIYNFEWPGCLPTLESTTDANTTAWPFCRYCNGWAGLGEFQRPFHPKFAGHRAFKEFLIDLLKRELD